VNSSLALLRYRSEPHPKAQFFEPPEFRQLITAVQCSLRFLMRKVIFLVNLLISLLLLYSNLFTLIKLS